MTLLPSITRAISLALCGGMMMAGGLIAQPVVERDVLVYGGTAAGVIAAVRVAREGYSVALIEPTQRIGGMTSGGLGATDIGNKRVIGGLAREFYQRVRSYYDSNPRAWHWETRDARDRANFSMGGHEAGESTAWTFEPHVAEQVLREWLAEAKVTVVCGERLALRDGVTLERQTIRSLHMESGREFRASLLIDASYEGDLMALAGVRFHVGRESNEVYGETLNGIQTAQAVKHQFTHKPDPFVIAGDPKSGLLPGLLPQPPGPDGSGDDLVQAYCFRVCTTDVPENRGTWSKPDHYDAADHELLLRNFEAGDQRIPWHRVRMPNRKTDTNNNFAISTDFVGGSHDYPNADYAARARIVAAHRNYQQGLFWTLANHPRVPEAIRKEFQTWGPALDEFVDTDHWPEQLYVREARRMIGPVVMTEHHCRGTARVEDPVGMAAYTMDSHHMQRYVDAAGVVRNEGDVQVGGFAPYPISWRSIRPRPEECANLLVPVCLSASHIAWGSIRMEPVFMVLADSAATAACLALETKQPLDQLAYQQLRQRLLDRGQVLE